MTASLMIVLHYGGTDDSAVMAHIDILIGDWKAWFRCVIHYSVCHLFLTDCSNQIDQYTAYCRRVEYLEAMTLLGSTRASMGVSYWAMGVTAPLFTHHVSRHGLLM